MNPFDIRYANIRKGIPTYLNKIISSYSLSRYLYNIQILYTRHNIYIGTLSEIRYHTLFIIADIM